MRRLKMPHWLAVTIVYVLFLVVLASLAAALVNVSTMQHASAALDLQVLHGLQKQANALHRVQLLGEKCDLLIGGYVAAGQQRHKSQLEELAERRQP